MHYGQQQYLEKESVYTVRLLRETVAGKKAFKRIQVIQVPMKIKSRHIIITACSLYVIYIGTAMYSSYQFEINARYTIGIIDSVKNKSVGLVKQDITFISYIYKNRIYHYEMDGHAFRYLIGKRIFVDISSTGNGIGLGADCLVPDKIRNSPFDGWNKEWMKKNFPDCYLIKEVSNDDTHTVLRMFK